MRCSGDFINCTGSSKCSQEDRAAPRESATLPSAEMWPLAKLSLAEMWPLATLPRVGEQRLWPRGPKTPFTDSEDDHEDYPEDQLSPLVLRVQGRSILF